MSASLADYLTNMDTVVAKLICGRAKKDRSTTEYSPRGPRDKSLGGIGAQLQDLMWFRKPRFHMVTSP